MWCITLVYFHKNKLQKATKCHLAFYCLLLSERQIWTNVKIIDGRTSGSHEHGQWERQLCGSGGESFFSSIKLMTNVCCSKLCKSKWIFNSNLPEGMMGQLLHLCDNHCNLKLDSCSFKCFKLVIQKQHKSLALLQTVQVSLCCLTTDKLLQSPHQVRAFPHQAPPDVFSSGEVLFQLTGTQLFISFLFLFYFTTSPKPTAQPVNQWHFLTDSRDVRPIAGGRFGVWPHPVSWHRV